MKLVVLLSCMGETDFSIIQRTNIQSDVVVVNQCDKDDVCKFHFTASNGKEYSATYICTRERGLSKSRNMALRNAPANSVCLICDDDEMLTNGIDNIISKAYSEIKDASVITFKVENLNKTYDNKIKKIKYIDILRTSSVQITFKKDAISTKNIVFDEKLGAGTGNGSGEENKFLLDCGRAGLKLYYYPKTIAQLLPSESTWFMGYDKKYLNNLGWSSRRSMGDIMSILYGIYWVVTHRKLYGPKISIGKAYKYYYQGFKEKRLGI